jgi:nucleoside-diphosphate-sugar epimerase
VRRPEIYRDNPTAGVLDITKAREKLGYEPKVDRAALVAKAQASIRG